MKVMKNKPQETNMKRLQNEDFYHSPEGFLIFTEAYHLKRGYCCKSGCRHCPYGRKKKWIEIYGFQIVFLLLQPQTKKPMARVCQITGKKTVSGNNVSHANNRTKRKFYPNLQNKRLFLEEEGVWVNLKVSTHALRIINKLGLSQALRKTGLEIVR